MHNKLTGAPRTIFVALFIFAIVTAVVRPVFADGVVPGYILVKMTPNGNIGDLIAWLYGDDDDDDDDSWILEQVPNTRLYALRVPPEETEAGLASRAGTFPGVEFAETDTYLGDPKSLPFGRTPPPHGNTSISDLIPQRASLAQLLNAGLVTKGYVHQSAYTAINLGKAQSQTTGAGVKVAVLDTGVNPEHPTLYGRCTQGYNAINADLLAHDLLDGVTNQIAGHGTMIASLIARIAPGVDIVPVRTLNADGTGTGLYVVKGIYFSVAEGARVLNLSLSSLTPLRALEDAVRDALAEGAVLVASAGNDGLNRPVYPAAYAGVLAVAALEVTGKRCDFSNYGAFVSVCAPGRDIHGAYWTGGYANWSGTSFAAPFVAAQAALIFSRNPSLTGAETRARILDTARSVDKINGRFPGLGAGMIDIQRSLP